MKKRSKAGRRPAAARRSTALKPKGRSAPKALSRHASSPARETEVARAIRERDEALEQQAATSEVLKVISRSPGDLEPVFEAMLVNAVRICDAKFGNIYRWDGEALNLVATIRRPLTPNFAGERLFVPIRKTPSVI